MLQLIRKTTMRSTGLVALLLVAMMQTMLASAATTVTETAPYDAASTAQDVNGTGTTDAVANINGTLGATATAVGSVPFGGLELLGLLESGATAAATVQQSFFVTSSVTTTATAFSIAANMTGVTYTAKAQKIGQHVTVPVVGTGFQFDYSYAKSLLIVAYNFVPSGPAVSTTAKASSGSAVLDLAKTRSSGNVTLAKLFSLGGNYVTPEGYHGGCPQSPTNCNVAGRLQIQVIVRTESIAHGDSNARAESVARGLLSSLVLSKF